MFTVTEMEAVSQQKLILYNYYVKNDSCFIQSAHYLSIILTFKLKINVKSWLQISKHFCRSILSLVPFGKQAAI